MTDYTVGDTIHLRFTTRNTSGVPTTLAGTPVVAAYEADSAVQITAGVTLGVDHDTVTGLNLLTIVATGANGFEAGKDYDLVITTGTVGGTSVVGEVVGRFSLGRSSAFVRLGAPAAASIAADLLAIDNFVDELESRLTAARAGYLDNLNGHVAQTGDSFARIGATGSGLTSLASAAALATAQADLDTLTGADGAIIASSQGALTFGAITISVAGATNNVTLAGSGTGDGLVFSRSGSGGLFGTNWAAAVQSEANDALVALGLDHLVSAAVLGTDIADDSIIAQLVSKSATADWDSYDNATDALEALRDRGDAAWVTGGGGSSPILLQSTTIATLASQTSFTLTAGSADDGAYDNQLAIITDQVTGAQKAVAQISTYTGSTKTVALAADPGIFTMAVGDTIDIIAIPGQLAGHVPQTGDSYARLGAPAAASIAADLLIIDNLVDDLESRLTSVRAGYLDNLNGHVAQTGDSFARLGAPVGASISADIAAVKADTVLPEKNVALSNVPFLMVDSADHVTPKASLTVTGTVSKDGGAFGAISGSVVEISNGIYNIDAAAADMNADFLVFRFTATGADDVFLTFQTR